jgi:hypothetical protein
MNVHRFGAEAGAMRAVNDRRAEPGAGATARDRAGHRERARGGRREGRAAFPRVSRRRKMPAYPKKKQRNQRLRCC